jgi:long-chain acyl-CoA synthetase
VNSLEIIERLVEVGGSSGRRVALRQDNVALTYDGLLQAVELMARRLLAAGVTASSTIAVLCENRPEVMVAYYAAARLGAVFVPVNPILSAPEVAHIVHHSDACILVHDADFSATAATAFAEPARRWSFERLAQLDVLTAQALPAAVPARGDFLVIYTSGSTGAPKAVVFDQTAEVKGNDSLIEMWGIGPQDVTLVALPLGFLYGLSTAAATGIQAGGEVVLLRKFHPRDVLEALVQRSVTIFHGVPTMFAMMLNYAEEQGIHVDLSRVRLLISAGAPLAEDLRTRFERRFRKRLDDYYALTEARPVFGRRFDDPQMPPRGAIGKAAPGVDVRVIDTAGQVLGVRQTGELVVRVPGMFTRYAQAPELTDRALGPHGFRTGDLCYCDEQGYFYLTGRIKDIIIRGGANIAPAEVENILTSHPSVRLAAVVGAPDPTFGERVVGFAVLRADARATAQELVEFCAGRLAEFKVPRVIRILEKMPLGSTGKIDKNALKKVAVESRE